MLINSLWYIHSLLLLFLQVTLFNPQSHISAPFSSPQVNTCSLPPFVAWFLLLWITSVTVTLLFSTFLPLYLNVKCSSSPLCLLQCHSMSPFSSCFSSSNSLSRSSLLASFLTCPPVLCLPLPASLLLSHRLRHLSEWICRPSRTGTLHIVCVCVSTQFPLDKQEVTAFRGEPAVYN